MIARVITALTVVALLVGAPARAQAPGEATSTDPPAGTDTRSPLLAGVLEWVVPTVGYAYAGAWRRGLVPNSVRVGGLVLAAWQFNGGTGGADVDRCPSACVVGLIGAVAGTVWAVAGAARTAASRGQAGSIPTSPLRVAPSPWGGVSVGLALRPRLPGL